MIWVACGSHTLLSLIYVLVHSYEWYKPYLFGYGRSIEQQLLWQMSSAMDLHLSNLVGKVDGLVLKAVYLLLAYAQCPTIQLLSTVMQDLHLRHLRACCKFVTANQSCPVDRGEQWLQLEPLHDSDNKQIIQNVATTT